MRGVRSVVGGRIGAAATSTYPRGVGVSVPSVWLNLDYYLSLLIWVVAIPVGLYAFIHALLQRADAFTAVDKLTKPAWCAITGVGALLLVISFGGPVSGFAILWLVALCAVLVYLVDVRPKVTEVQQGGRW